MKRTKKDQMTVAHYLSLNIEATGKTQTQIAEESGFEKSNIITMMKKGQTKVPLGKIGPLARSLGIDAMELWTRAMREYFPDTWAELERSIANQPVLTRSEIEVIELIRAGHIDASGLIAQSSGTGSTGRESTTAVAGIVNARH